MDESIKPIPIYDRDHDCDLANRQHKFAWIWVDGRWTDRVRCGTCGKERDQLRKDEALDHSSQQ